MALIGAGLGLLVGRWLVIAFAPGLIITVPVLLYLLANIALTAAAYVWARSLTGPQAWPAPAPGATPPVLVMMPPVPAAEVPRGFIIGLAVMANFRYLPLIPFVPGFMTLLLCGVQLGSAALFLSRNRAYKVAVGWSGLLLPTAWLAIPFAIVGMIWAIAMGALTFFPGMSAFRIDWTTGTLEVVVRGPFSGFSGFGLWNTSYIDGGNGATPALQLAQRTEFNGPGISAHESAHTLNNAGYGGLFAGVGWLDENVFSASASDAYAEVLAQGHVRDPIWKTLLVWS